MIPRFGFIEAKKGVWDVVKISTGQWVQFADHEHALAEKDAQDQQIREHEFQRGYQEGAAAMLAKAVQFARYCDTAYRPLNKQVEEAQAFLKEHP